MALPPTIPTSFVPKQPVVARSAKGEFNPFLFVANIIFFVWVVVALLVFGYQFYLNRAAKAKANEVLTAQNSIDEATVTQFIRLRDRFTIAQQSLDKHVLSSRFFDRLESITIQNVQVESIKVTIQENRTAKLEMKGTARNFNALAAQSSAYAKDPDFKNAIFSGFTLDNKNGSVAFQLNADIESTLLTQTATDASLSNQQNPQEVQVPINVSTSTTP